jgi:hypothetical protein
MIRRRLCDGLNEYSEYRPAFFLPVELFKYPSRNLSFSISRSLFNTTLTFNTTPPTFIDRMAPLTPDATQNAPVARQIISSFNDMTEEERHLVDQIIDVLAERNLSNERANDETRRGFWNAVFHNGWNTNELSICPGELPDRQFRESALLIGHFSQDLPPSKGVARKASKSETPLPRAPVHRR